MTPQEAAEQYATTKSYMDGKDIKGSAVATFIAGAQWQSEQDNQALSSALKEIAELTSWKNEMLQLWNKLDAYIETRKDIRLGESKVDFAIKIMKERDEIYAKNAELQKDVEHNAKRAIEIAKERDELHNTVKDLKEFLRCVCKKESKNTDRFSPESHTESNSANLPPEVTA